MEIPEPPVMEGHIYRCPVEGCHCEISIVLPPKNLLPIQPFVDCCGHEMVKVSVDETDVRMGGKRRKVVVAAAVVSGVLSTARGLKDVLKRSAA